jgi:hypothetical protein
MNPTALILRNCKINDTNYQVLADGLVRNDSITEIDLSKNLLTGLSYTYTTQLYLSLNKKSQWTRFSIEENRTDEGFESTIKASCFPNVVYLNTSKNSPTLPLFQSAVHFFQQTLQGLQVLNLEKCSLNDDYAEYISQLIEQGQLLELNLHANSLTDHGFSLIGAPLFGGKSPLRILNLSKYIQSKYA